MGKKELVALLGLSSWCLMVVVLLFLAVPWVCLQFEIVVFPDHTHLQFLVLHAKLTKDDQIACLVTIPTTRHITSINGLLSILYSAG